MNAPAAAETAEQNKQNKACPKAKNTAEYGKAGLRRAGRNGKEPNRGEPNKAEDRITEP